MAKQRKANMTFEQVADWLLVNAIPVNDCLHSHLRTNAKGYVPVGVGGRSGEKWRAHRLIYHIKCEPLTKTDLVMHTCDIRHCINPAHLRKGTAAENTQDMMAKGRGRNGGKTKVDWETYQVMLALNADGLTNVAIGKYLNLSHETVRSYLNGKFTF